MAHRSLAAVSLLLVFTVTDITWADDAHFRGDAPGSQGLTGGAVADDGYASDWLDPVAVQELTEELTGDREPVARVGPAMRLGTAIGFTTFAGQRVNSVGGYVSAAWQFGRFAVEADYGLFRMNHRVTTETYSGSQNLGRFHRGSLSGRLDLIRLGRDWVGDNSKLIFWLQGGIGRQAGSFDTGESFQRNDVTGGFGWLLDHRLKKPLGFPSRVGWHFGWRLIRTGVPTVHAKSATCKAPICGYDEPHGDTSLLVSSGVHFSW